MYQTKQKCTIILNNSSIIEKEIIRTLKQTQYAQADEIFALQERLEESR